MLNMLAIEVISERNVILRSDYFIFEIKFLYFRIVEFGVFHHLLAN